MHFSKLLKAHELYYEHEPRAHVYDEYMLRKNSDEWYSGNVSIDEVNKLFKLVHDWEYHFKGNPFVFKRIYDANYRVIEPLIDERVEKADFG